MHLSVAIPGGGDPRDIHRHGAGFGEICWQLLAWDGGIALILYFLEASPGNDPYLSNTPTNLCMALLNFLMFCFILYCYVFVQYLKTIQYNPMHKFVGVLVNLRKTYWICNTD